MPYFTSLKVTDFYVWKLKENFPKPNFLEYHSLVLCNHPLNFLAKSERHWSSLRKNKIPWNSDYKELSCQALLSKAFQKNNSLNWGTSEPRLKSVLQIGTKLHSCTPLSCIWQQCPRSKIFLLWVSVSIPPWQPLQEALQPPTRSL